MANLRIETLPDGGAVLHIPAAVNVTETPEYRNARHELAIAKNVITFLLDRMPDKEITIDLYDLDTGLPDVVLQSEKDRNGFPRQTYRLVNRRPEKTNS